MVNIRPSSSSMSTFSMCELRIQHRHRTLTIVFMYRPPPSKGNKLTSKLFVQEFQDLLDCYISTKDLFVICDFNLHFESNSETYATQVKRALKERNLDQLISVPTHVRGHTIDWLVTNAPDLIANLTVEDKALSDHFLVSFVLKLSKPRNPRKIITSRKLKNINMGIFGSDAAALLSQPGSADVCTHCTTCLKTLLDSHAPLITRTVPDRPSAPWMSDDIKTAIRTRRRAERIFKKTGLSVHRQMFVIEKNKVNRMVRDAKSHYLGKRIKGSGSSRELFRIAHGNYEYFIDYWHSTTVF